MDDTRATKIQFRASKAFKANTQKLIEKLYAAGFIDRPNMSEYIIDAVKEKRERDSRAISEIVNN